MTGLGLGGAPLGGADLAVLTVAAFLTSVLSAVLGLAGGITLLAVMLQYLEPTAAIPLHGAIQLLSNGSRAAIQRRHLRWDIVWPFAALLLPAGLLAVRAAQDLPGAALRLAIGVVVLLATWAPGLLRLKLPPSAAVPRRRFLLLGGAAGALNVTIGATGPLMAPFFLGLGLARQALVGTQAACQTLGHLAKIVAYGALGFAFAPYLPLLGSLGAAVLCGSWVGSHLLERVGERGFVLLYRSILTLLGLRLLWVDGWRLVAG